MWSFCNFIHKMFYVEPFVNFHIPTHFVTLDKLIWLLIKQLRASKKNWSLLGCVENKLLQVEKKILRKILFENLISMANKVNARKFNLKLPCYSYVFLQLLIFYITLRFIRDNLFCVNKVYIEWCIEVLNNPIVIDDSTLYVTK